MKKILIIGLILLVGCTNIQVPCALGWGNDTHVCNEFHYIEKRNIVREFDSLLIEIGLDNCSYPLSTECRDKIHNDGVGITYP